MDVKCVEPHVQKQTMGTLSEGVSEEAACCDVQCGYVEDSECDGGTQCSSAKAFNYTSLFFIHSNAYQQHSRVQIQ